MKPRFLFILAASLSVLLAARLQAQAPAAPGRPPDFRPFQFKYSTEELAAYFNNRAQGRKEVCWEQCL
jgi:hypothetical protein